MPVKGGNVYLLIPEHLEDELLEPLRAYFADDDTVEVIVERRTSERRAGIDNRILRLDRAKKEERRAQTVPRGIPDLPPALQHHASELRVIQRMTAVTAGLEDLPIEDVVARAIAGDPNAPTEIYWRTYERVSRRLAAHLHDPRAADQAVKPTFGHIFDRLETFFDEGGDEDFNLWLDGVVDEEARRLLAAGS